MWHNATISWEPVWNSAPTSGVTMRTVLWFQAACCGGETVSLLNADQPDFLTALDTIGLRLVWHAAFSRVHGEEAQELFRQYESGELPIDILVVEGAVYGPTQDRPRSFAVDEKPVRDRVRDLAGLARYTVAVGTCACFGGLIACGTNPMQASGLQYMRDQRGGVLGEDYRSGAGLPVINVPGCPAHPDWIIGTLAGLAKDRIRQTDLDRYDRPGAFYGKLAHHGCPRNEYYEFKASACEYSHQGCLFENLGCKATQCESDCNERLWLARTGSCPRGGFPCLSCTSPNFPDGFVPFFETAKIGDIPTTLPRDVPKAWYIGISGLSKLACPQRLRVNAVAYKPTQGPSEAGEQEGQDE